MTSPISRLFNDLYWHGDEHRAAIFARFRESIMNHDDPENLRAMGARFEESLPAGERVRTARDARITIDGVIIDDPLDPLDRARPEPFPQPRALDLFPKGGILLSSEIKEADILEAVEHMAATRWSPPPPPAPTVLPGNRAQRRALEQATRRHLKKLAKRSGDWGR